MKVNINNVRLAFPALWEAVPASKEQNAKLKFQGTFIVDPKSPAHTALMDTIKKVAQEKWPDKWQTLLAELEKKDRICYRREEYKNSDGEVYGGFEGMHYIRSSSDTRPLVIDRNKAPLLAADGRPYSGCYVNAQVDVWAQDSKDWGKRINCTLRGVQFNRDGDSFSGGTPASADDFDDLGDGADAPGTEAGGAADPWQ